MPSQSAMSHAQHQYPPDFTGAEQYNHPDPDYVPDLTGADQYQ